GLHQLPSGDPTARDVIRQLGDRRATEVHGGNLLPQTVVFSAFSALARRLRAHAPFRARAPTVRHAAPSAPRRTAAPSVSSHGASRRRDAERALGPAASSPAVVAWTSRCPTSPSTRRCSPRRSSPCW